MDWQTPLALLCVALAALALLRPLWSRKSHGSGCSTGCGNCPAQPEASQVSPPLVQLGDLSSLKKH